MATYICHSCQDRLGIVYQDGGKSDFVRFPAVKFCFVIELYYNICYTSGHILEKRKTFQVFW